MGRLLLFLSKKLGTFLCQKRQKSWARKLTHNLWIAYTLAENRNYDANTNGEKKLLEKISNHSKTISNEDLILFDIGANKGDWSLMASHILKAKCKIFAFEIIPHTFAILQKQTASNVEIHAFSVGMGSTVGEIEIFVDHNNNEVSSAYPSLFFNENSSKVKCPITTGDVFTIENKVTNIDFLKIDVEGMEKEVLLGFKHFLSAEKVGIIQLEYGFVNVQSGFLLKEIYQLLEGYGYVVGKLYPTGVEFKKFHLYDENFIGPNFIAVHKRYGKLVEVLNEF